MNQQQLDIEILKAKCNQRTYRIRYEEKGDNEAFLHFIRWTNRLIDLYNQQGALQC